MQWKLKVAAGAHRLHTRESLCHEAPRRTVEAEHRAAGGSQSYKQWAPPHAGEWIQCGPSWVGDVARPAWLESPLRATAGVADHPACTLSLQRRRVSRQMAAEPRHRPVPDQGISPGTANMLHEVTIWLSSGGSREAAMVSST